MIEYLTDVSGEPPLDVQLFRYRASKVTFLRVLACFCLFLRVLACSCMFLHET